jgi:hypothetical protein
MRSGTKTAEKHRPAIEHLGNLLDHLWLGFFENLNILQKFVGSVCHNTHG